MAAISLDTAAELEDRLQGSGLWDEPRAHLNDDELVALFRELSEDNLVAQLRHTADAARAAAEAYRSKAQKLSTLADQLDAKSKDEEKRLIEERVARGRRSNPAPDALLLDPDTIPTIQESERRW